MDGARSRRRLVLVLAAAMFAGSCSAGAPQEASSGAPRTEMPRALRLAVVSRMADAQVERFEDQLEARSRGALSVAISRNPDFDSGRLGVEQEIVRGVADGRLDLGWVGARAFGELGVHDFDALIAPMQIQSAQAQRAVLASGVPERMLGGLRALGVTGLGVFAGPMRRPIAARAPLVTLEAFKGVRFYAWHGAVARDAVEALGAVPVDAAPPDRNEGILEGTIAGYESTLKFLADNAHWKARTMTVDVHLWPTVGVLVINPKVLAGLSEGERAVLAGAVAATGEYALSELEGENAQAERACRGGARLATAGDNAVRRIDDALERVRQQMSRDPVVGTYLDEVRRTTAGIPAEQVVVPEACAVVPSG